ncbi:MAG TPA: Tex family protein [Spirochaetota bacterium]|nr:Tex family protein [Spirochaetota bacterium]
MKEQKNILLAAGELSLKPEQVAAVVKLLEEDATVPFIARYRKEVTGNLDEVAVIAIRDRIDQLNELDKRREAVIKSLTEQEKLTPELEKQVMEAETLAKLEDIYLPYRPKRRTRGMIAKEKGLEPLAEILFLQEGGEPDAEALRFIDSEKGVGSADEALQGAGDIIAEWVNENSEARDEVRGFFAERSAMSSRVVKGSEKEGAKYRDYFEWNESVKDAPSHRILALLRGSDEGHLLVHFLPEEEEAVSILERRFVKSGNPAAGFISDAVRDSYKRLMGPSMETELRSLLKKRADDEAIRVFAENVKELLLASPLGQKSVLALDPGLRTGCKLACLSKQGNLVYNDAIYPLEPYNKTEESARKIKELCAKYKIEAIAIGNGTGGREALAFCKLIGLENIIITMVNESGASVYSASEVARREFPDHDVTVRGAVSIGRRLMDPLAELVKIDPKSIGVGQYQHDVDQKSLKKSLDDAVMSCVNAVGVEVNTASGELLKYVSGLSPRMADAIVKHRDGSGPFRSREDLKKVSGMGPKTFEQAAGFLRIREGENPLDRSAVHPESYGIVGKMAEDLSCTVSDLINDSSLRSSITLENYVTDSVGMPTLKDIMAELEKPGRDPRKEFELFSFREGVNEITDLEKGMALSGVVTNVTAFGAFVDIGVHQDGLVHISHLADRFIDNPNDFIKVNQKVQVTVIDVDVERKRIALSMKSDPFSEVKKDERKPVKPEVRKKKETNAGKKNSRQETNRKPESPFAGLKDLIKD